VLKWSVSAGEEVMNKIRSIAASLMLISGVTHVVQIPIYGAHGSVIGAAAFGVVYFIIGLFLFGRFRAALWAGAVLPAIGGVLGVYRFIFLHPNPFSVFHVLIDLVVVPCCIILLVCGSQE